MKLGKAMALGTHLVDSKHDQTADVPGMTGFYVLSGLERYLLFSIFVCSVIRSNSNTSNSDAGKKVTKIVFRLCIGRQKSHFTPGYSVNSST